ncbi:MAG: EAL domain-containing protein [Acidimicrobiia bacterium]|nr:EAL domain-containing protein [Acidimicrobiia bacterium]
MIATLTKCSDELDQVLGDGAVRSVYQPIVELATGDTVAFEALARGPVGSGLERPVLLFAAARSAGRLDELDWACRAAALRGAMDAGLDRAVSLFVNVEPEALRSTPSTDMLALLREAGSCLNVMVEVTERALVTAPAELLRALSFVRALGWGVALDDVGAEVASLALMPFVRPDVIKLDLRLIQDQPDREIAAIVSAVDAQAERSGAQVLAEGIETAQHRDIALAMGATLGQGWPFARPAPLADHAPGVPDRLLPQPVPSAPPLSPMVAASAGRPAGAPRSPSCWR